MRNVYLDCLRLLFCCFVMWLHITIIDYSMGTNYGYLAVEFFYIVSGYYLMNSVEKRRSSNNIQLHTKSSNDSSSFILHKISSFFAVRHCC